MRNTLRWSDGALVGLGAALVGALTLLAAGLVGGAGSQILTAAGRSFLPSLVGRITGASPALSYLLCHALLYTAEGVIALRFARLADHFPGVVPLFLLVVIAFEFGFLGIATETRILSRLHDFTWRALLAAHFAGDIALVVGILLVHPGLRQAVVRGYNYGE